MRGPRPIDAPILTKERIPKIMESLRRMKMENTEVSDIGSRLINGRPADEYRIDVEAFGKQIQEDVDNDLVQAIKKAVDQMNNAKPIGRR